MKQENIQVAGLWGQRISHKEAVASGNSNPVIEGPIMAVRAVVTVENADIEVLA